MTGMPYYHSVDELPRTMPIFPLPGALLLPRGTLPLNIFEPRYVAMIEDALKTERLIGMIQPDEECEDVGAAHVFSIGCAGRITQFTETDDGRYLVTLTGVLRFRVGRELPEMDHGYRLIEPDFASFGDDLRSQGGTGVIERDILIDHLKEIYIDATLKTIETSNWHATVARKDYSVGLNLTAVGVDDPDANFFENYSCGSQRNYTGYCNQEMEKLFVKQSMMTDQEARRKLVWNIDKRLQEDAARPIIYHGQAYTCFQPKVKGFVAHVNSLYNGWRMEDVWLDK